MMKIKATLILVLAFEFLTVYSYSQRVGINSTGALPNASALLDVDAAPGNNMGLLIPRVALTATNSNAPIGAAVATSLLVYNTATAGVAPNDVTPGYYYWDGAQWVRFATGSGGGGNAWLITGNAGITAANFLGTINNAALRFRANNTNSGIIDPAGPTFLGYQAGNLNTSATNTGIGFQSLFSNNTGSNNTAIGFASLASNTLGTDNTATGLGTLQSNTLGKYNSAHGIYALANNTTGHSNVAMGVRALNNNTARSNLIAIGDSALYNNGLGVVGVGNAIANTAVGSKALYSNTDGAYHTAIGYQALYSNTTGRFNTATGSTALYSNTTGNQNTANGINSLYSNTTGSSNTASGESSLYFNQTGIENTATGASALYKNTGSENTADGYAALINNTSGTKNTAVGHRALNDNNTGYNNAALGRGALYSNTTGYANVAVGFEALYYNTTSIYNTAIGTHALRFNNAGTYNTAIGWEALKDNNSGNNNTATGLEALNRNTTGSFNTANGSYALDRNLGGERNSAIGVQALYNNSAGSYNTAGGMNALFTNDLGNYNTAFGYNAFNAGANFSNSTALGANAAITASNKVRIGDATVTVVEGQVAYTFPSDGRFKNNITEEVKGLDFINRLRPVVYNFDTRKFDAFLMQTASDSLREAVMNKKNYNESSSIRQSGFIAQEVEQAAIESGYNFNGVHKPANENDNYSIAYSLFTIPLVKAIQEQQKMIDSQSFSINSLQEENKNLKKENTMMLNEVKNLKSDYDSRLKKLEEMVEQKKRNSN